MSAPPKFVKINLLKKEDFDDTYVGQFLKWALTYGRYIIILTQIVVLSVFFLRFKLDRDHVDLKVSIAQKQALLSSVSEIENEVRAIQKRLYDIKNINDKQYLVIQMLIFLQDVTPTDNFYDNIHITSGSMNLGGVGHDLKSLSALLLQLKRSNKFAEITLDDIKRQPDGTVTFKISTKYTIDRFKS